MIGSGSLIPMVLGASLWAGKEAHCPLSPLINLLPRTVALSSLPHRANAVAPRPCLCFAQSPTPRTVRLPIASTASSPASPTPHPLSLCKCVALPPSLTVQMCRSPTLSHCTNVLLSHPCPLLPCGFLPNPQSLSLSGWDRSPAVCHKPQS